MKILTPLGVFFLKIKLSALGVPDVLMKTCRKILTSAGPLFREGGFYVVDDNGQSTLYQLSQVRYYTKTLSITLLVFFIQKRIKTYYYYTSGQVKSLIFKITKK